MRHSRLLRAYFVLQLTAGIDDGKEVTVHELIHQMDHIVQAAETVTLLETSMEDWITSKVIPDALDVMNMMAPVVDGMGAVEEVVGCYADSRFQEIRVQPLQMLDLAAVEHFR